MGRHTRVAVIALLCVVFAAALLGPHPDAVPLLPPANAVDPRLAAFQANMAKLEIADSSNEKRRQLVEAAVAGIDADVAAEIRDPRCRSRLRWHNVPGEVTELSIVYLHGFSASPEDLHPTLDMVAESLQANLLQVRLRGHGLANDGLSKAKASQWLEDVALARKIATHIGKRTLLVGMSTGGSLAILSAMQSSDDLVGLALLSPNFGVRNQAARILTWPWGREIASLVTGSSRNRWVAESAIRAALWTTDYDLAVAAEMQAVVDAVRVLPLEELRLPALVVHSNDDQVVRIEDIRSKYQNIGSKLKLLTSLPGSTRHELAGFAIAPELSAPLADLISGFFSNVLTTERR